MSERTKFSRRKSAAFLVANSNDETLKMMKELFLICDKNKDGQLTLKELSTVFSEMGLSASPNEIQELFEVCDHLILISNVLFIIKFGYGQDLDVDNSGTVTFDEFLGGIKRMKNVLGVQVRIFFFFFFIQMTIFIHFLIRKVRRNQKILQKLKEKIEQCMFIFKMYWDEGSILLIEK
jgi:hypothetical protein